MYGSRILLVLGLTTLLIFTLNTTARAECCECWREVAPRLELTSPYTRGEAVAYLQARLLELGFDPGPVDGVYGPLTHRAVTAFARCRHLAAASGVNSSLWQELMVEPVTAHATLPPLENPYITIDIATHRLTLYSNGKQYKQYPVACGTARTPTPLGEWTIVHKAVNWGSGFGTRWMGLNVPWGIYGIHGTNKPWTIGTRASHGCIRMYNKDVEELYPLVPSGTPVKIFDSSANANPRVTRMRLMQLGSTGPDVVYIQQKLKEKGVYLGYADGRYGKMTVTAVKYLQYLYGRPATGIMDRETYHILGLVTR